MPDDRFPAPTHGRCARPHPAHASRAHGLLPRALLPLAVLILTGCTSLPGWLASGCDRAAPGAEAPPRETAQDRLHVAVQASQPGQNRLAQARRALESLLADDGAEARAHHPYARALLEQIRERQRLSAQNERLTRELDERTRGTESHGRELEALRQQNAELQHKLDALTEIERRLTPPTRPAPPHTGQPR